MIDEYTGIPTGAKVSIQFEGGEPENAEVIGFSSNRYFLLDKNGFIIKRSNSLPDGFVEWRHKQDNDFPCENCGVVYPLLYFKLEREDAPYVREDNVHKWSFAGDKKNEFNKLRFDYIKNLIMRARKEI